MKISLAVRQKVFVVGACFTMAAVGFMIKLPSGFRHFDKELHAAFYFLAAALLNFLFVGKKFVLHVVIFIALYLFGLAIEYAQEYSNKFFHNRIHGRFDPADVQWNLKGLIAFSLLWLLYVLAVLSFKSATVENNEKIMAGRN